ncbi:MAG: hypothetical protein K0R54_3987 [Clostridiaceae bacterium]|jgi:O-antigen ligase|nr:hypothetical protein [Clostridiaceae bacterium]
MVDDLKKYLRYIIYFIIVEAILGGAGRIFVVKSLSFRMILYVIAFAIFGLILILDRRQVFSRLRKFNINSILIILFGFWIILTALHGYFISKNNLGQVVGDVTGYVSLALLLIFSFTFDKKFKVDFLMKLTAVTIVIQAAAILIIHYLLGFGVLYFDTLNSILQGLYIGHLANVYPGAIRVFFKSSIYLQIGFVFLVGLLSNERNKIKRILLYIGLILVSYAIIISFTRGFWLGVVIAALLYLGCRQVKDAIKTIAVILCGVIVMIGLSAAVYGNFNVAYSLASRVGINIKTSTAMKEKNAESPEADSEVEDLSAEYRQKLTATMMKNIEADPVIGNGFGVVLKQIGQEQSRSEYMYLDILMEQGAVGLILYMGLFLIMIIQWLNIRRRCYDKSKLYILDAFMVSFIGLIITSGINPFLNNPIGITYLIMCVSVIKVYREENL